MVGFLQKLCSSVLFPVAWTVFLIVLLCIPGSAFPDEEDFWGIESIDHIDKFIHVLLFGGFVIAWSFHYRLHVTGQKQWRLAISIITVVSIVMGVAMEFVQFYFIPFRDFEGYDIIADSAGALAAALLLAFVSFPAGNRK